MDKKAEKINLERVNAPADVGLSESQVRERIENGYVNEVTDPNWKTPGSIIARNVFTFFNAILFIIAAIFIGFIIYFCLTGRSDVAGKYFGFSKFVFLIPAVMNVAMGSIQEIHSYKVIKKLRIVTATKSKVVRDGELRTVDAEEIVLDDVVYLSAGDQATADIDLLEGEVSVDESMLTGESDYIKKVPGDRILSGSSVIIGSGKGRAVFVGDDTYAAGLSKKVKGGSRHKSELMTTVTRIIKVLSVILVGVLVTVFVTLAMKIKATGGDPAVWGTEQALDLKDPFTWALILLTGGSFGIGIIPSGLVLTTSVALVISIAQLSKNKTLVQELYSLENLSRVDIVCLDKTGTLTDGTMTVTDVKAFVPLEEIRQHAAVLTALAGDRNATMEAVYQRFGTVVNAAEMVSETIPFSSQAKCSGFVYRDGRKVLMGAPEYLLSPDDSRLDYSTECAKEGKRVLALTVDGEPAAFFAIEDHIRDTAPDTLRFFKENHVEVKVISGDNPLTVSKIAQMCGIDNADKYVSLAGVPLEKIPELAEEYTIFARVSPEQKEALVKALQAKGHKVAMTGDGVNDILALRRSDSSITFAKATEAAKSCSDVVLLDNDFSHLKEVVGEGRRVIGNIQKTAVLYLMKSIAVIILAFALIPLSKGQMWYNVENVYMLEAAVIGTGGFLISLEPRRNPIKGSFMKNIVSKSVAAGVLAAVAILTPVLFNVLPKAQGAAPFIQDGNVATMMTVMMTVSGIVVLFATCLPFNKYRVFTLGAVVFVSAFLGLLVPSSYVGGRTVGADMIRFDAAAGQTIFDSQLIREMFRPWNSQVLNDFAADSNNFILLRVFLYVAIPAFILIMFAAENYARKEFKNLKEGRAWRIGRRLMLASGIVLVIWSIVAFIELLNNLPELHEPGRSIGFAGGFSMAVSILQIVLHFAIGIVGYVLWKDPLKKTVKIAFVMGMILLGMTVISLITTGVSGIFARGSVLLVIDNIVLLLNSLMYVAGALIVRANYDRGQDKKRD
jgi:cation-transporting ATPase E